MFDALEEFSGAVGFGRGGFVLGEEVLDGAGAAEDCLVDGEFLFEFEFLGKIAHKQASAGIDLAGVRAGGAGGHLQEGGFAAAIASYQADAFAFENRDRGVFKEGICAEGH